MGLLPFAIHASGRQRHSAELRRAIASAYGGLPEDGFVPMNEFLPWHVQERNPLVGLFGERGEPCIALTTPGRYLLQLAEDFNYGHEHDGQGQVVVQPNFDVVFLAPAPLVEAAIARFAERKRRGHGTLFIITKKSILAAAGSGMTIEQVLETLQHASVKPIPANVAREITGWFEQCRRISVRSAILIACPDAETAGRVVAASGNRAVLLTETVVELADARAKTELLRKLHGMGVFVDGMLPDAHHRHSVPASHTRRHRGLRRP